MAINTKPKHSLNQFLGKPEPEPQPEQEEEWKRIQLRLPMHLADRIDAVRKRHLAVKTRHFWILEAIVTKLEEEESERGK